MHAASDSADDDDNETPPAALSARRMSGVVTQRSMPTRQRPPSDYVLCDPSAELPLLVLTIQATSNDAGWRFCKVWLWGLWCDRLAEPVKRGDSLTIVGATVRLAACPPAHPPVLRRKNRPPTSCRLSVTPMLVASARHGGDSRFRHGAPIRKRK